MKRIALICLVVILLLASCGSFAEEWKCPKCGRLNSGNFCPDCGTKSTVWVCPTCGRENYSAFCENCGAAKPVDTGVLIGKWKFSDRGSTIYLTIKNESEFTLDVVDGERIEGTYAINGIYLTFTVDDHTSLSGEYSISDKQFAFEHFGVGERTEEASSFLMRMDGQSMVDTIQDGDVLKVECIEPSELKRFDIVVVHYPDRGNLMFVKRLTGFPGDTVELRDGYLYLNGERYAEEYIADVYRDGPGNNFDPFVVPENSYFIMGDHRNNSNDSRSSYVGALSADMMIGKVTAVNGNPIMATLGNRIAEGVYIDNICVGGMSKEEAISAVKQAHEMSDAAFDISVTVGNETWHVTPERVPVSRNITETVNKAWELGRDDMALRASFRANPEYLETEVEYDHTKLRSMVDGIANYVNRDPINSSIASFNFKTHVFTFAKEEPGITIDPDDLYHQLTETLDSGVTAKTIVVTPEKAMPALTEEDMINKFGLISSCSLSIPEDSVQATNVRMSTQAVNGIAVLPGEIFSFNMATGERTAAKGYIIPDREDPNYEKLYRAVSLTSSVLLGAVIRADLDIYERNPFAKPSEIVEIGQEAAVNWPGLDFRFKNDKDWPIFIVASYTDGKLNIELYGERLEDGKRIDTESKLVKTMPQPEGTNYVINTNLTPGESKTTIAGREGYVVETSKIWYQGDKEIRRELVFTTTYRAYQEIVEYNPK